MPIKHLSDFVKLLERENELVRIKQFVNPELEITEITDRISKNNGPALLFENTGTAFPLLINAYGSEKRMCLALGVNQLDDIAKAIKSLFQSFTKPDQGFSSKLKLLPKLGQIASWMPVKKNGRGASQETIMTSPDLRKLPVMKCWPFDGGPFLTLPMVHTIDPENGIRNIGLYRMQVFDATTTAMHWHKHKVSAGHYRKYKKLHQKMPVAIALGGDPILTYCATAPLPPNLDEYILAGFLRKKKVELHKCLTQDIWIPADADIILEGFIDPDEDLIVEGPFGDHTGYYSLEDYYPKFHLTAITHRKNAIYPSTIVGIPPQEDAWIGKATERIFLEPIKMTMLPEIHDMDMPVEGVFHNLVITSIEKEYEGHADKVKNSLWGAGQMMFNKILIVTSKQVNVHDYWQVAKAITQNTNPAQDVFVGRGPMDVLDHAAGQFAFGGKLLIDATEKSVDTMPAAMESEKHPLDTGHLNEKELIHIFPEITAINTSLLQQGISCLILAIEKNKKNHVKRLTQELLKKTTYHNIRWFIYCEPKADIHSLSDIVWRVSNNIDPQRDCYFISSPKQTSEIHIAIDGSRKYKAFDEFERDWPNIICSDKKTIQRIDTLWPQLGLGKLLASPSAKYANECYPGKAKVD